MREKKVTSSIFSVHPLTKNCLWHSHHLRLASPRKITAGLAKGSSTIRSTSSNPRGGGDGIACIQPSSGGELSFNEASTIMISSLSKRIIHTGWLGLSQVLAGVCESEGAWSWGFLMKPNLVALFALICNIPNTLPAFSVWNPKKFHNQFKYVLSKATSILKTRVTVLVQQIKTH